MKLKGIFIITLLAQIIGLSSMSFVQAAPKKLEIVFVYLNNTPRVIKNRTGLTLVAATREAVAKLNRTLRNSAIPVSARSVRITRRNMDLSGETFVSLAERLKQRGTFQMLRKRSRAELITVVIPDSLSENLCGYAYYPPWQYLTTTTKLNPNNIPNWFGLSLVNESCLLTDEIFAHEIGHNLGADHDKFAGEFISPFVSYGKGMIIPAFKNGRLYCFKTSMSYGRFYSNFQAGGRSCQSDIRIDAFSHPGKTLASIPEMRTRRFTPKQKQKKIGAAKMNNAKVVRKIAVKVAKMY